jgi:hypothetical protein
MTEHPPRDPACDDETLFDPATESWLLTVDSIARYVQKPLMHPRWDAVGRLYLTDDSLVWHQRWHRWNWSRFGRRRFFRSRPPEQLVIPLQSIRAIRYGRWFARLRLETDDYRVWLDLGPAPWFFSRSVREQWRREISNRTGLEEVREGWLGD